MLNKKNIHSVLFWGKESREIFFNVGLPTILSKGNLDKPSEHIFYLITTPQDEKKYIKKKSFIVLDKRAEIKIIHLNDDLTTKFGRSTLINVKYATILVNKAFDLKCGYFCWSADCVISNNLFLKIHQKISEGYQGVGTVGDTIRYNKKNIDFFMKKKKQGVINFSPKKLIKFALKNEGPTNINNIIDNKQRVRTSYPSRAGYQNLNFRISFGHKFHAGYLIPQNKIVNQFIGGVDFGLASNVINLKKYYIIGSFTEKELKKKKYNSLDLQDPAWFSFYKAKRSDHFLHGNITPKIMAEHHSTTFFKNEKKLLMNTIIQNWRVDKNLEKKILLIQSFRKEMIFFLTAMLAIHPVKFFLKKKYIFLKSLLQRLLNVTVKIFNFFKNKI